MVYDVLVLAQMSDDAGLEQEFLRKVPDLCFADSDYNTANATVRWFYVFLACFTVIFCVPRLVGFFWGVFTCGEESPWLSERGYTLFCGDRAAKMGEALEKFQSKIIVILTVTTGILGIMIGFLYNGTPPSDRFEVSQFTQTWASVLNPTTFSAGSLLVDSQPGLTDTPKQVHTVTLFLNDIANGDYHHAYDLSDKQTANAYYINVMSVVLIVLGVGMFMFKVERRGEGDNSNNIAKVAGAGMLGTWA